MSPYAQTLAQARLDALQALQQALQDAETPDEKRRCAVAIFNAPDPCNLDDSIEWADANNFEEDQNRATGSLGGALRGQPVPDCNNHTTSPEAASREIVPPAFERSENAGACCNLRESHAISQIERVALAACPPVMEHWGHNDLSHPQYAPPLPDLSPPPCAPTG